MLSQSSTVQTKGTCIKDISCDLIQHFMQYLFISSDHVFGMICPAFVHLKAKSILRHMIKIVRITHVGLWLHHLSACLVPAHQSLRIICTASQWGGPIPNTKASSLSCQDPDKWRVKLDRKWAGRVDGGVGWGRQRQKKRGEQRVHRDDRD